MATIEIETETLPADSSRSRIAPVWPLISILWSSWRQRRADRAALAQLRSFDERTLRDMGFEPAEIYGAHVGTLAEVHGDAWKGLKH